MGEESFLSRTALLVGDEAMQRIATRKVILFGVGGVGSWCAEALVRSGVRRLTIVDGDIVAPSNVNRQLMATSSTVGRVKVEVMRERLLDISPEAEITALHTAYTPDTAEIFQLADYDCIIDAIDSIPDKVHLLCYASTMKGRVISSMGAARKVDTAQVSVTEFWKVQGCPLARALRKRMKQTKQFPAKKIQCVYSPEQLQNRGQSAEGSRTNGTLVHVTALFGLTLAGLVLKNEM